jgi:hypothetical protein
MVPIFTQLKAVQLLTVATLVITTSMNAVSRLRGLHEYDGDP